VNHRGGTRGYGDFERSNGFLVSVALWSEVIATSTSK
jgi:hypothetical protein